MKNKMTLVEFKNYIKQEAEKLFKTAILKEEKERIEKELSTLNESTVPLELGVALMDPDTLKKVRQEMLKKAAGWVVPEPEIISEKKYSDKASNFIGKEIGHLQHDKGYTHDRAVAAAINVAKDKGYKVPAPTNEIDQAAMDAAKKDIEADGGKFEPLGQSKFEKHLNKKELHKAMSPESSTEKMKNAAE